MKKAFILCMVLALFCAFAMAEEAERETYVSGDYKYALLDDGTAEITRYSGSDEELAIPSELDGYAVTAIGDEAFSYRIRLTQITIPDSVTAIGDEAFSYCISLTQITIPDSVTAIGVNPFRGCYDLSGIIVSPDHPTLATIDGVLFSKADKRLVCYPRAFTASNYSIPQGIQVIGNAAFYSCGLTQITIPDSVTAIGDEAFSYCISLTQITIPDSVTTIGANPFCGCSDLSNIIVSPDHPTLATIDGVLFSKADKRLVCYPCAFTASDYSIPQGIQVIGGGAFCSCSGLTQVTIPDSVTAIGNRAFLECYGLAQITIPDSVTSIGDEAFSFCKSLTQVTIPDSVTAIGDWAFYYCYNLTQITIPDGVTSIGNDAFKSCGLTQITIPDSVTAIGDEAFSYCHSLTSIVVGRDSCAMQYCIDNNLPYTYPDANDWLND